MRSYWSLKAQIQHEFISTFKGFWGHQQFGEASPGFPSHDQGYKIINSHSAAHTFVFIHVLLKPFYIYFRVFGALDWKNRHGYIKTIPKSSIPCFKPSDLLKLKDHSYPDLFSYRRIGMGVQLLYPNFQSKSCKKTSDQAGAEKSIISQFRYDKKIQPIQIL